MSDDTQKVVINTRYGGFGISDAAAQWLCEKRGWETTRFEDGHTADEDADLIDTLAGPDGFDHKLGNRYDIVGHRSDTGVRTDADLIDCVEALGEDANGKHAELEIVEIPADINFEIKEYDGSEWVAEEHRTWGKS